MVKRADPAVVIPTYTTRHNKVAITNVRVFDGTRLLPPSVVVIQNGLIGKSPFGAEIIDAHRGVLLPGFIDSHVHTGFFANTEVLRNYGVTSAMDMGCVAARMSAMLSMQALGIQRSNSPTTEPSLPTVKLLPSDWKSLVIHI